MVRTHSKSGKSASALKGDDHDRSSTSLVRGKGKGVIILVHGVPGVGKSSTAECVAEYTERPLFSITCGMYLKDSCNKLDLLAAQVILEKHLEKSGKSLK